MAEEHIVIPRERYNRLMQQINKTNVEEKPTENAHHSISVTKSSQETTQKEPEKSIHDTKQPPFRTRDDITLGNPPSDATADPPGVTPEELQRLLSGGRKKQTKKPKTKGAKRSSLKSVKTTKKDSRRKRTVKNVIKKIKKNWLTF